MKPEYPTQPLYGPKYGTAEHYESMFSDILADAGNGDTVDDNRETIENILNGFEAAIKAGSAITPTQLIPTSAPRKIQQ